MEYGAIDLHKKESQVRIISEMGEVIDRRIPTTRDRLTALFWGRPHARIVIEASTESEWVAQHLESLGHEVIVADPNFGLMATRAILGEAAGCKNYRDVTNGCASSRRSCGSSQGSAFSNCASSSRSR